MSTLGDMSLEELASFVASHLAKHNIEVVLVGGACVSIYTENQYQTRDLDFVERYRNSRKVLAAALAEIGFTERNRYFEHPETDYYLEFPAGPVTVGNEPVIALDARNTDFGQVLLLTATDCVKDRLSAYFHWNDRQCLVQAINIAKQHNIDVEDVRNWSEKEGEPEKFERFLSALSSNRTDLDKF